MKITIFRIILIILLAWTFIIIFGFSSQEGEESGTVSRKVTKVIVEKYQPLVRKLAHFSIYTVVGILIMMLISTYDILLWKRWSISIATGVIYAISDEFHQSFIPGRAAQIKDVFIDSMGVIFGILITLAMISIYKKVIRIYGDE